MAMCAVCGRSKSQSVERLQSHRNPSVAAMRRERESMDGRLCTRARQQGASLQLITRAGVGVGRR